MTRSPAARLCCRVRKELRRVIQGGKRERDEPAVLSREFLWAGRPSPSAVRGDASALPRQAASLGAEVRGAEFRLCGHDLSVPSALGGRLQVQGAKLGSTLVPLSSFHPFTGDTQRQALSRGELARLCFPAPPWHSLQGDQGGWEKATQVVARKSSLLSLFSCFSVVKMLCYEAVMRVAGSTWRGCFLWIGWFIPTKTW